MKSIVKYIGILALAFTAVCCVKEKGDTLPPDTFRIDTDEYSVIALDQNAQVAFIPVVTNVPEDKWEFESTASWCSIGRSLTAEKGVMVSVSDNTDKEELRRAQVCVRAAGKEYLMSVVQTGYGPAIIVKDVSVGPEGGLVNLDIISNVQLNEALMQKPVFNAEDGDNWIRFHNLAVLEWRHRNFRMGMNPLRIRGCLEAARRLKVPTAEANLKVLLDHIPESAMSEASDTMEKGG